MLVDAHAHLDMYDEEHLPGVLDELERSSVLTLSTSVDPASFEAARAIAEHSSLVVPGFGVHPWEAHRFAGALDSLEGPLTEAPYIGEIGLDHRWVEDTDRYPAQRTVFAHQLSAASRLGKLVNVHTAGAEREVLDLIDGAGVERVIIHWYSGPDDVLAEMVDRGFFFTVGVQVLMSDRIRQIASMIPLDRLLTETDNPGGLEWLTGAAGRPAIIPDVVGELASLQRIEPAELVDRILGNFSGLVASDPGFAPWLDVLAS